MSSLKHFSIVFVSILYFNVASADIVRGGGVPTPPDIDKAIELDPNNADLYNIRGNTYLLSREYIKAIQDFKSAIRINPNYAEPYNGLGIAYRNMNDFAEAIKNYTIAIRLYPGYFEAYNNRGAAYFFAKDYTNMCSDFRKACNLGSCEKLYSSISKGLCK